MSIQAYGKNIIKPSDAPNYKKSYCNDVQHDQMGQKDFNEILKKHNILSIQINNLNMCFSYEDIKYMLTHNKNLLTNKKLSEYEKGIMTDFLESKPAYYTIDLQIQAYDQLNDLPFKILRNDEQIFEVDCHTDTYERKINRKNLETLIDYFERKIETPAKPLKFYGSVFPNGDTEHSSRFIGVAIISFNPEPFINIYYDKKFKNDYEIYTYTTEKVTPGYNKIFNKYNIFKVDKYDMYTKFISEPFHQNFDLEKTKLQLNRYYKVQRILDLYKFYKFNDQEFKNKLSSDTSYTDSEINSVLNYTKSYWIDKVEDGQITISEEDEEELPSDFDEIE